MSDEAHVKNLVAELYVKSLVEKAAKAAPSDDAMRYAQAALNAANALRVLWDMDKQR